MTEPRTDTPTPAYGASAAAGTPAAASPPPAASPATAHAPPPAAAPAMRCPPAPAPQPTAAPAPAAPTHLPAVPGPVSDYPQPYPVQTRGHALARALMRLWGWRVEYAGLPALQGVFAVYAHTSNWDFPVGVLTKWGWGLPIKFWGKDSLFKIPLIGRWMRHIGGVPIDRSSAHGVVADTLRQYDAARAQGQFFWVVVAPEGTRRRTPGWKTGFYQTAFNAKVPLGLVKFDWARRVVSVTDFIELTGDMAADFARIRAVFTGVQGARPDCASPIEPLPPRRSAAPQQALPAPSGGEK